MHLLSCASVTCVCVCVHVRTVKSCIKAAAYVQFFNFLVWLLFDCGLYAKS